MDANTFQQFKKLIYEKSGISNLEGKEVFLTARIGKRLKELRIEDPKQYLKFLVADKSGDELVRLLDVVSTNVTNFFRENDHFDFLAQRLEDWSQEGQKRFRIWSAASSTGEEPYSLSMTACAVLNMQGADLRILATDISTRVLKTAKAGKYPLAALKDIPAKFRQATFLFQGSEGIEMSDFVKQQITFSRINLSAPPFAMKGPFDIVFCRNVMIYFDNVVRLRLVKDIYRLLRPGGYLMVGHSESLTGIDVPFKVISPSIYYKASP